MSNLTYLGLVSKKTMANPFALITPDAFLVGEVCGVPNKPQAQDYIAY